MIQTTANFNENVNSASGMLWDIQLFDGNTQITDIITNVNITAYGDNNGLSIGSVCARSITFDIYEPTIELINKELLVKIGANGEYVPYGYYTVIITEKNRNITSYTLVDRIAARLDKKYVSALTFPTTDIAMLNEICAQANMPLKALEGQISHKITSYEQNYTLREIVGYLAQMQGKNAIANADGQLELRWYKPISKTIDNSKIYMDSQYVLNTNEGFTLGYLKCIAEDGTELAVGNGVTGITIKNPFMTQEIVNEVFLKIRDFSYFTSKIEFLGDLRLEPMDVVTVVKDGVSHSVPIIQLTHKYDGGVRTSISATSQSEVANSLNLKSSLQNQVDRIDGKVVGISQTITDVEGNVSNISQTVDTVSQTVSNLSGDVSNISQTVVGITQTVTNISQDLTNNYSTTTQMQSAIEQSAQSIEASVVKNGEISSKLSLEEGTVSIVGDRFTVDSTNFKLSEDGTVECDAGTIGGWGIEGRKLESSSPMLDDNVVILNSDREQSEYTIMAGPLDYGMETDGHTPFMVGFDGSLYAEKGTIGGFELGDKYMHVETAFKFGETGGSNYIAYTLHSSKDVGVQLEYGWIPIFTSLSLSDLSLGFELGYRVDRYRKLTSLLQIEEVDAGKLCVNGKNLLSFLNPYNKTIAGKKILAEHSKEALIREFKIYGKSEQVTTNGNNIFDVNAQRMNIYNISNDYYLTSKTPTSDGRAYTYANCDWQLDNLEPQEYWIVVEVKTPPTRNSAQIWICDTESRFITGISNSELKAGGTIKKTISYTGATNIGVLAKLFDGVCRIAIYTYNASEYEPYTGGEPAPSIPCPQNISNSPYFFASVIGDNIFNEDNANWYKGYLTNTGGVWASDTSIMPQLYIPCMPNHEYKVFNTSNVPDLSVNMIAFYDENKVFISHRYQADSDVFTTPYNCHYIRIAYYNFSQLAGVSATDVFRKFAISSSGKGYEPYIAKTSTFSYNLKSVKETQDELIVRADGTGKHIRKIMNKHFDNFNFSALASINGLNRYAFYNALSDAPAQRDAIHNRIIMSDKFKPMPESGSGWTENGIYATTGNHIVVEVSATKYPDVSALTSALTSSGGLDVQYVLDKPIVTYLTREQVEEILNPQKALTFEGATMITNNRGLEMEVTYLANAEEIFQ